MANARIVLPRLYGGVSRQGDAIRHANQVSEAENAMFTVQSGVSKRPGSSTEFAIQTLSAGTTPVLDSDHMAVNLVASQDYRVHTINRDSDERYVMVYGAGTLRVWDVATGVEGTITFSEDAKSYFNSGSPGPNDLKFVTIADYTLCLNKTVATATKDNDYYATSVGVHDYMALLSRTMDDGDYAVTENDDSIYPAGYFRHITTDNRTFAVYNAGVLSDSSTLWTPSNYFTNDSYNPGGFGMYFYKMPLAVASLAYDPTDHTLTDNASGSPFATYADLWEEGDQIWVTGQGWKQVMSVDDENTITIEDTGWSTGNVAVAVVGFYADVVWDMADKGITTMHEVAAEIQRVMRQAGATDALVAFVDTPGNKHMQVTHPLRATGLYSGDPMTVLGPTTGSNYHSSGWPFYGGSYTAATGSVSVAADYHLPASERWERVAAPGGQDALIDATSMPLKIVRTDTDPLTFEADVIDWTPRYSGDHNTNPVPSILDNEDTISDIAFHRNRLVLAGSENVLFSQAGDFFNFWVEYYDDIADADPIDIALSSDQITLIDYIIPFRKGLVIFTLSGRQFELSAPEILTYNTASITQSTAYQSLPGVRPAVMGNQIYFAAGDTNGAQLLEYFYSDSSVSNTALDISEHVGGYIPRDIKTIDVSLNHNTVILLEKDTSNLYVYHTHWNGTERVQSAWGKYSFHVDERIVDFGIIENEAWMLMEDTNAARFFMTKLSVSEDSADTNYAVQIRLDNRQTLTGLGNSPTTWTLAVPDQHLDTVVLEDGTELPATYVSDTSYTTNGDNDGAGGQIGKSYEMDIELSRPYIRADDGSAILDMNIQMQHITCNHYNSGEYTVRIVTSINQIGSAALGDNLYARDYVFTPDDPTEQEGTFQARVAGMSKNTKIHLRSDSAMPCSISTAEIIVTATPRSG